MFPNSNLREGLSINESTSESYQEQAAQAAQMAKNQSVSSAHALADSYRQTMDYASHQAKSASSGESFNMNDNAGLSTSATKIDGLVDRFVSETGLSKEDAKQLLFSATASVKTGVGFSAFGTGASAEANASAGVSQNYNKIARDNWSAAEDFSRQNNLQDTLSQASQAVRDTKYSEMSDEGKRLSEGISSSYEKSNQYREEANKSLQQSQSYSKTASWLKTNAGSINQNLNQEYVGWLSEQSLPNSSGRMGIREAETILSSRPSLNHQYQESFMEQKMAQIESIASQGGLPSSMSAVGSAYNNTSVANNTSNSGLDNVRSHATSQGLGDAFSLDTSAKSSVTEKLERVQDQIAEQTELIEKEAKIREGGFGK